MLFRINLAYYEAAKSNGHCEQPELEDPVRIGPDGNKSLSTMALSPSFFWTTLRNIFEQLSYPFIH